jgi:solute carrier family 38 (sodium-coupled neutral amino acid transporter), member 10
MGITSAFSTLVSSTIYLIVGIFGYFTFASAVSGNILTNYEDTEVTVQIGRIALTFTILFSYPIVSFPLKIVLSNALFKNVCPGFANTHSIVINMAITCGIIFSTFLVAVFVPDVSLIFGLLGGLTLSFVCFVIPSMVYLKLNGSRWCSIHSILPIFMSIFGIFVAITTLGYETKKLVDMIISVVQKPK